MDWSKTERGSRLHPPDFGPAGIAGTVLSPARMQRWQHRRTRWRIRSGANSKHWAKWLGVENRCVVTFSSFSEFTKGVTKGSHSTNPAPSRASPATMHRAGPEELVA